MGLRDFLRRIFQKIPPTLEELLEKKLRFHEAKQRAIDKRLEALDRRVDLSEECRRLDDEARRLEAEFHRALQSAGLTEASISVAAHSSTSERERPRIGPQGGSNIVKRGGFNEPYCSEACYSQAGGEIANRILAGARGVCGFCQSPVHATHEAAGDFVLFPFRKQLFFICKAHFDRGKSHVATLRECCMCGKPL